MIYKITISKNFFRLLSLLKDFNHEVGGLIFGVSGNESCICRTLSLKHGKRFQIDINSDDSNLFILPIDQRFIGTWHLHVGSGAINASMVDINQWKNLDHKLIHIIINTKKIGVFFLFNKICEIDYCEEEIEIERKYEIQS